MPLHTTTIVPPGGFAFLDPVTRWSVRDPLLPFEEIVKQIYRHRWANKGLYQTDQLEVEVITIELHDQVCRRLKNNSRWCRNRESEAVSDSSPATQNEPQQRKGKTRHRSKGKGCPTCGRRKKRQQVAA